MSNNTKSGNKLPKLEAVRHNMLIKKQIQGLN